MMATISDNISWPLIIFTIIVIAVRYKWFNLSQYERYINNTLALAFVAQLLGERVVEKLLSDNALLSTAATQQLSLAAIMLSDAEFMGFVSLWSTRSLIEAHRRHRRYRIAAVILVIAFLAATARARAEGRLLELPSGWDGALAWVLFAPIPVTLSVQLFRMCVKEIGRPDVKRRERLVAAAGVILSFSIGPTTLVVTFLELCEQFGWTHGTHYLISGTSFTIFSATVFGACLAAVPWVLSIVGYYGLDRVSRNYRKLSVLRGDLIAVVPEIAFGLIHQNPGRRKTMLELHQTTVQIRDAILQLRRYFSDIDSVELLGFLKRHAVPVDQHREAALALQLAYAVRAKQAGALVAPPDASVISSSRSTTLEEEAAELLKLSRWWPYAQLSANMNAATLSHLQH